MTNELLISMIKTNFPDVKDEDCICRPCRTKFSKKLKDPTYTPEKTRKKERDKCILSKHDLCSENSDRDCQCSLVSFNSLFSLNLDTLPTLVPLCLRHRSQLSHFEISQTWKYCSVCEVHVKDADKYYFSSSLSDEDVNKLCDINDQFTVKSDGILCTSCYRYCHSKRHMTAASIRNMEIDLMKRKFDTNDDESLISKILNDVYLHVCKLSQEDGCFLFVTVYEFFLSCLKYQCENEIQSDRLHKSSIFLKGRIIHQFGTLLKSHTAARKRGTFFYKADISQEDIINSWHMSVSKLRSVSCSGKSDDHDLLKPAFSPTFNASSEVNMQFRKVAYDVNDSLRMQANRLTNDFVQNPMSLTDFDFNSAMSLFDPLVWNIICMLTATLEELHFFKQSSLQVDREFIKFKSDDTQAGARRRQRRITCVFLMQYIMNDENGYPLHIIIANCVKKLSHSSKLLKILNHVGLSCSESTLDRFLQVIHDNRTEMGPLSQLSPSSVTFVSIDNIDVLTPYAAVTVDKSRSWHGTSVMAQQPKPLTEHWHPKEKLNIEPERETPSVEDINLPSTSRESNLPKPAVKVKKPSVRRRLAHFDSLDTPTPSSFQPPLFKTVIRSQLTQENFSFTAQDVNNEQKMYDKFLLYVIERLYYVFENKPVNMPSLKCKLALESDKDIEQSSYSYMYVLNEKADSPETIKHTLGLLYESFNINKSLNHLVIAGDGATIRLLLNVKREYGEALDWVIPYLGDWHILKNFQEVLMKIFWDAGLKDVAKLSHKQSTLRGLASCSNFKHTHRFILQVYEAILMLQFNTFLSYKSDNDPSFSNEMFMQKIKDVVSCLEIQDGDCFGFPRFIEAQQKFFIENVKPVKEEFVKFCHQMSDTYETFKFWHQFLVKDCLCYINLWLAIRTGDWNLRLCALKSMAPLFHAFDRQNYSYLIPCHLSQLHSLPEYVLDHFKRGAFVSSLTGANFSQVALDEAHEMLINKDVKTAFSEHLPQHVEKISATLECQAQLVNNLEKQTGAYRKAVFQRDLQKSVVNAEYMNVKGYFEVLSKTSMFSAVQPNQLYHIFSKVSASPVQRKGLLEFRQLGEEAYDAMCKVQILNDSSVKKPVSRKFRLKTFTKEKLRAKKVNDLEKEKRLITLCYKRTIAYSEEKKIPISDLGQFIQTPRAICLPTGLPYKGAKSVMYDQFEKRYTSKAQMITSSINFSDSNVCVIIEGMNIIYSSPLKQFKTFKDYACFLIQRWIYSYFRKGYREVRILFDEDGTQGISPKGVERSRRDTGEAKDTSDAYESISDGTTLPSNWMNFLKIRKNKHMLCRYLSKNFRDNVHQYFQNSSQMFVTSGGFHVGERVDLVDKSWTGAIVDNNGIRNHDLVHNHEESDTQIWLHVDNTSCDKILIYSIDRDIGMIGLPLSFGQKQIVIQYRAKAGNEKFLNLNDLQSACILDPDVAQLIKNDIDVKKCFQVLYICSGCDFVSYFAHLGKAMFFKAFFQFATFVSGHQSAKTPGNLSQTSLGIDSDQGLLSFYRLVLCVYFIANRACLHDYTSPIDLFDSVSANSVEEHHSKALDIVRRASWKGTYEDQLLPSDEALRLHWSRSCWASTVWSMVRIPKFDYPNITKYGFKVSHNDGAVVVDFVWDSEENMNRVKEKVLYLTRGCSCSKSKCVNRLCKCKKQNSLCGPGCRCKNCENTTHDSPGHLDDDYDENDNDADEENDNDADEDDQSINSDFSSITTEDMSDADIAIMSESDDSDTLDVQ